MRLSIRVVQSKQSTPPIWRCPRGPALVTPHVRPDVVARSGSKPAAKTGGNKNKGKKASEPPSGDDEKGEGVLDLDALLADPDSVRQLRLSIASEMGSLQQRAEAQGQAESSGSSVPQSGQKGKEGSKKAAKGSTGQDSKGGGATRGGQSGQAALSPDCDALNPDIPGAKVMLKGGKGRLFSLYGSPMVYGGAIDRVVGRPAPTVGDAVVLCDAQGAALGWGVYNPNSMFRVRIMQSRSEYDADGGACFLNMPALIRHRVAQASSLRTTVGLPTQDTNVYRLINSEGDRLSGIIADVLGSTLVVQSVAGWAERYRSDVELALKDVTGLEEIVWRPSVEMLREEGVAEEVSDAPGSSESDGAEQSGQHEVEEESDPSPAGPILTVLEAGLKYNVSPLGQKTGFYADQRDSRKFLAPLCKGKRVLDLCCFAGGFSISAAVEGALEVTGVDSSAAAVNLATSNAALNGVQDKVKFVRADISAYMKECLEAGEKFDVLILDPPKLAPNRASLERAKRKYQKLNKMAMQLVKPGGLLMTCSCSGAMTQSGDFKQVIAESARQVNRHVTVVRQAGAALDHPLDPSYPEGAYLTNVTVRVA